MSSKKKERRSKPPEDEVPVPPPDDPGRRGERGPVLDDENDRAAAEARLKAMKQAREMRRPDPNEDPDEPG